MTSAIPVQCSTNWAMKPHIGSEVNLIDLAPNVWLHSSVGRASHRYRRGHGFESRWSLDFFRLLLSNCLNWKIYCDDHSLLCVNKCCFNLCVIVFCALGWSLEQADSLIKVSCNTWNLSNWKYLTVFFFPLVVTPLDVVKTRLQAQLKPIPKCNYTHT